MNYKLEKPTITKVDIPITEYHQELITSNKNPIELFIEDLINVDGDTVVYSNNDIYIEFKKYCSTFNLPNQLSNQQFHTRLNALKINGINKKMIWSKNTNTRGYVININEVKKSLNIEILTKGECYVDINDDDSY